MAEKKKRYMIVLETRLNVDAYSEPIEIWAADDEEACELAQKKAEEESVEFSYEWGTGHAGMNPVYSRIEESD